MIGLKEILSHYHIVVANYDSGGGYSMLLYPCRYKRGSVLSDPPEVITEQRPFNHSVPLLLYVCGYGVIHKPALQAAQILADQEKFLSTLQNDGTVCFVRRSQIGPLLEWLGNSLLHIGCVSNEHDIVSLGKEYYTSHVNVKALLRADTVGSQLSVQLYKKAKLPVLIAILGMLLVNFAISGAVEKKYNEGGALLIALQNAKGRQDERSKQEHDMLRELDRGVRLGFAYLSDCIGSAVPESVVLHNLSIQPPVRRIEEGRPFHIALSKIVIKGETMNATEVSLFVSRLRGIERAREVKIISVEQSREGQAVRFVIEIEV